MITLRMLGKLLIHTNIFIYTHEEPNYKYLFYRDREEIPEALLDKEVVMIRGVVDNDPKIGAGVEIHLKI